MNILARISEPLTSKTWFIRFDFFRQKMKLVIYVNLTDFFLIMIFAVEKVDRVRI